MPDKMAVNNMVWETKRLSDVVERFIDYRGKTPKKVKGGIPLITAKIIKNGFIETPDEFIPEEMYDTWMTRGIPQWGDVFITTEAPLGEIAQVNTYDRIVPGQRIITLQPKTDVLDSNFLKYSLMSPKMQQRIHARASGSTVQGIKNAELQKVEIDLPPLPVQRRIGEILRALDDKIEVNQRINQTMEQMARALYQHWFVDNFEENYVPLTKYVVIDPPTPISKDIPVPYIDMKALPTYRLSVNDYKYRNFSGGSRFQNGDTLFARITPCLENGKTAYVDLLGNGETGFGSTEFIVLRAKPGISPQFVYCCARDDRLRNHAIKSMVGTSGRQRVRTDCFDQYFVKEIDPVIMQEFHEQTTLWFEQIHSRTLEKRHLANIKDFLLPKLLSGEIEPIIQELTLGELP